MAQFERITLRNAAEPISFKQSEVWGCFWWTGGGEGGEGAVNAEANGIKFMFTGTSQNRRRSMEELGHNLLLKFPLNAIKIRSAAELHFLFLSELAATTNNQVDPRPGHASCQNLNQKNNAIGYNFFPRNATTHHPVGSPHPL